MRPSTKLKQQKIIEVATQLFLKQGYHQTNLDQIIEQCGGSKQTIYSYFGDKRGLLIAVIGRCIEEVESIFNFKNDDNKTLEQQLIQFGTNYLDTILSPTLLNTFRILLSESQHDQELADFYLNQGLYRITDYLRQFLLSHMEQGHLKHGDPSVACGHLLSLLKGYIQHEVLFGVKVPPKTVIRQHVRSAVDCFLNGYRTV
ncbi:TetR/AcrR family transcriptional regulator [Jinshanibacter sp. LJY008]|uniref:TetR/AcrR family transcriptional regulator n=1 Tax=Limnobaculum eriocheiris TaxID=2897391 RepID=A0A9X1MSH5_9GAMM|nr:TetR/AcrR family transcriptional regulator [Limnobaculum eriocheiris]MCD1124721.1 TetR/AcrR family transcriptional regulator [Limnobaculum eriocheiris]